MGFKIVLCFCVPHHSWPSWSSLIFVLLKSPKRSTGATVSFFLAETQVINHFHCLTIIHDYFFRARSTLRNVVSEM